MTATPDIAAWRPYAGRNPRGLWSLYRKEVMRFVKVATQTVMAPLVTTLLFLAVFALALGGADRMVGGVPYVQFLAPGLVMMAIVQNGFANTSSSIVIAKVQGNVVDMLMPPLSPAVLTAGFALAGMTRGLAVGLAVGLAMAIFVGLPVADPFAIVFHAAAGALMLALIGIVAGLWSEKFDHISAVTNFVVTPLAFLSGTFYSVERLPAEWAFIAHLNPFFYMIDGFRAGFIGHADGNRLVGFAVLITADLGLWILCHRLFRIGYKLKP
ncbi:ABC-2 type transport system permease protein [Stella humosa]|uniref:Transport permease protein n=1 Tax=Stella humosa TaxID=94 RepID=A0A3N1KYZ6_9PROT|nr:ABC transporter permease [Stella humosa]ROP84387.1 ABC-2 type transport system permease protein [Stella humosa]BBK33903.1 transport permease protein [Stella humosa]